jgi:hypothetical protein
VHNDVVAGVDDYSEVVGIHRMIEAEEKFRSADTPRKSGNREFSCGRHGGDKDAGGRRFEQVENWGGEHKTKPGCGDW